MSYAQFIEEQDFARSYNPADKFAGFDRGDTDFDDAPDMGQKVIGRMTNKAGQRVVIIESWCDALTDYVVHVDASRVHYGEDKGQALEVARQWMRAGDFA